MANSTGLSKAAAFCIVTTIICKSHGSSSGDNQTRIHITGEVEGYPTLIFCGVPFDIRSTKVHINIVKYDFEKPDEVPELYFRCYWPLSSSSSELDCSGRRGVFFGYAEGQVLHIQIPKTSRKHEGRYECRHGFTDHRVRSVSSELYVRGSNIGCNTRRDTHDDVTNITCHFNSDLRRTRDGFLLEWRPLNNNKLNYSRVLSGMWTKSEPPVYTCYDSMHNHEIKTHLVGDKVIFSVPKTSPIYSGQFQCGTVPGNENVKVQTCKIQDTENTTCSVPSVQKGDTAQVMCKFQNDVNQLKQVIFSVKLSPWTSRGNASISVLECKWSLEEDMECLQRQGFVYHNHSGPLLTLNITQASEEHVGQYACVMMTRKRMSPEPRVTKCTFALSKSTKAPTITTTAFESTILVNDGSMDIFTVAAFLTVICNTFYTYIAN